MVAKVRFWLSESSSSIAKAMIIILVMILKSSFLYVFFLQKGHFIPGRQHLLFGLLNGRF